MSSKNVRVATEKGAIAAFEKQRTGTQFGSPPFVYTKADDGLWHGEDGHKFSSRTMARNWACAVRVIPIHLNFVVPDKAKARLKAGAPREAQP